MSKLKVFETELALRNLAKALPGHEEAINGTLDKVASLEARLKAAEDAADKYLHEDKRHQRALLAAETELARLKAQEPQYQIQKFTDTNSRDLWVDVSSKQEAENQVVHGYTWRAVYAEPRPAVLEKDIENILQLLADGEWAEHCTKSSLGKKLEEAITELHNEISGGEIAE